MLVLKLVEGDVRSFEQGVALAMQEPIKHFEKELAGIRTGRANTKLIEEVKVECYGQMMNLRDMATLAAPDARLLTIQPWDKSTLNAIEKGILALTGEVLKATLHRAAVAAGITCSRKGAQPPYKHELKGV